MDAPCRAASRRSRNAAMRTTHSVTRPSSPCAKSGTGRCINRSVKRCCRISRRRPAAVDADIVLFMDGDGADDLASIRALIEPIRSGAADFVIGSRVRGIREAGSMSWHQVVAGLAAGFGIRLLYGVRYTDMGAFRAI